MLHEKENALSDQYLIDRSQSSSLLQSSTALNVHKCISIKIYQQLWVKAFERYQYISATFFYQICQCVPWFIFELFFRFLNPKLKNPELQLKITSLPSTGIKGRTCFLKSSQNFQMHIKNKQMNRIISKFPTINYPQSLHPHLISLPELTSLQKDNNVLVVEISKAPTSLFRNSLWVGYRNGGMASWLSTLFPHLPFNKFCLYMDETQYSDSEYMYSYYGEYFQKQFHSSYLGLCIHPRDQVNSQNLACLDEVTAQDLPRIFNTAKQQKNRTVLLDFRGYDQTKSDPIHQLIPPNTAEYVNLPLNDDDFIELLEKKIYHLPPNLQFITMCAKGYRSLIGYSLMRLIAEEDWRVRVCRNSYDQIKASLTSVQEKTDIRTAI